MLTFVLVWMVVLVRGRVLMLGRRVGLHGRGNRSSPPNLSDQHPPTDRQDAQRGDQGRGSHDHIRWQDIGRSDHDRREHEDPDRVRQADGQAKSKRVEGRAPCPNEIRRHQGLAVARGQGMAGTQGSRGHDGQQQDERGQVRFPKDRRQLPADPAGDRGPSYGCGRRRGSRRDRADRIGIGDIEDGRGYRRVGQRIHGDDRVGQRSGEEICRIGRQSRGGAGRAKFAIHCAQGHAVSHHDHLAPAQAVQPSRVGEGDSRRRVRGQLHGQHGLEDARQAQRRETTGPQREGESCLLQRQGKWRFTVHGQREPDREFAAAGLGAGPEFCIDYFTVIVQVDRLATLEGGDLGFVDDNVQQDTVGLDADAGVVVDGEVAQRMGHRGGDRTHQHGGHGKHGREQPSAARG